MKPRTTRETAMICVAAVLAVALVAIHPAGAVVLLWLALTGVIALAVVQGLRYLTTSKRAQIELTGAEQYRTLAEEYRRLADLAITAQEHTDLKLGEVSAQLDYLREQNESLHKILKEVE
jgi:ABC-type phosphate transport system auxiliary subunit